MSFCSIITGRGEFLTSSTSSLLKKPFFVLKSDPNINQLWQKNLTNVSKTKNLEDFKKRFLTSSKIK